MFCGTTLIANCNEDAMILAVDSKGHSENSGKPVPPERSFKKCCVIGGKFAVGTVGMIEFIKVEYEFEKRVTEWIETEYAAIYPKTPARVATKFHKHMSRAIHAVEKGLHDEFWKRYPDGKPLVKYVFAGYDEGTPEFYEARFWFDGKQRKILDTPFIFLDVPCYIGNTESIRKIDLPGIEWERYRFERSVVARSLARLPPCAQEITLDAVARINVEAYFNDERVGGTVNVIVIERQTDRAELFSF
jgi:hypothetical protein